MTDQYADTVRLVVEAWQRKLDACGIELWQMNRPSHQGKLGEGPVDLALLAADAVAALVAHSGGDES